MIVAAYQGRVAFSDIEANTQTVIETLKAAEARGAEILAMPETFLTGYYSEAAMARKFSLDMKSDEFARLLDRLEPFQPTLLLGFNERRGGDLYNTIAVIEGGKLLGRYSKNFLVFRYHKRGHEFPVFEKRGIPFGVVICADTSYIEPARILAMKGARIIFSPHFNYIGYEGLDDHTHRVRQHHIAIAIDNDVFVVRSNVVVPESQGTAIFGHAGVGVGDSFILDRRGRPLAEAGLCKRVLLVYDIPDSELKRSAQPWRRVSPEIAQALHEQYQALFARHENTEREEQ